VQSPEVQFLAIILWKPGLGIKVAVVVACNNDLLAVRKRGEPVDLLLYLLNSTIVRQVSGMNQHVAIGHRESIGVCVRDANNLDLGFVSRRFEWCATKAEEDGVDKLDESS
jgi:hypothetical protein